MSPTLFPLSQAAAEYGAVSAREIVLHVKRQLGSLDGTTVIIAVVVLLALVWVVKKM
jgi:hypothetical protein